MDRIFISYRRADSAPYAGRLFDRLRNHFGDSEVFMDLEGIEAGAVFAKVIVEKVRSAEVLIALIGTDWLTLCNADGTRRLDDPNDLVVREIETALAADARVIPVLAGGATMPTRSDLPARIADLSDRNAIKLSDERFHVDVDRLIQVIERSAPVGRPYRSRRWVLATVAALVALLAGAWIMYKGNEPSSADAKPVETATDKASQADASGVPAPVAAAESPPTWEQIKARPVIYSESFDPATVLEVWKPESPPRRPWTEELKNGRYCVINASSDTAVHYIHVNVEKYDLRDAPVFVKVQAEGGNPAPIAGGGVLYRFDGDARTYYAFMFSPTGQVTLWRRTKEGLSKLYGGAAPRSRPGQTVVLGMAARGSRIYLFVDDLLVATVDDTELHGGKVGVVAMSKGRFCFDDFTVRSAAR